METDQILDLFNLGETDPNLSLEEKDVAKDNMDESDAVDAEGNVRQKGKRGVLDELTELWDERQYEDEFDLQGFLSTMKA